MRRGGSPLAIEARLVEQLCLYDWPFNVRELDLAVRRLLTLHGHEPPLKRSFLPPELLAATERRGETPSPSADAIVPTSDKARASAPPLSAEQEILRDLEALRAALRTYQGNVARDASPVRISRQRAYRPMDAA